MIQLFAESIDNTSMFQIDPRFIYIFVRRKEEADMVYALNNQRKFTNGRYEFRPVLHGKEKALREYACEMGVRTHTWGITKPDIMARVLTRNSNSCHFLLGNIVEWYSPESFSHDVKRFMNELNRANDHIYSDIDIDYGMLTEEDKSNPIRWFNRYIDGMLQTDKLYEKSSKTTEDYSTTVSVRKGGTTRGTQYSVFLEFSESPVPEVATMRNDALCAYLLVLIASASDMGFLPKSIFDRKNRDKMPKTMNVIRDLSKLVFNDPAKIEQTLFNYSIKEVNGTFKDNPKKSQAISHARKAISEHDKSLCPATIQESIKTSSYYCIAAASIVLPEEMSLFPIRLEKAMRDEIL